MRANHVLADPGSPRHVSEAADRYDLVEEFLFLAHNTKTGHRVRLFRAGVPFDAAWGPTRCAVAPIETTSEGLFEPAEHGPHAVIVADGIVAPPLVLVDELVAFNTANPGAWWLRRGDAPILGMAAVDYARGAGEPIDLHETPWDWLRAGCDGAVIVQWDRVDPRTVFAGIGIVRCTSDHLRKRLRQRIRELNRVGFEVELVQVEDAA